MIVSYIIQHTYIVTPLCGWVRPQRGHKHSAQIHMHTMLLLLSLLLLLSVVLVVVVVVVGS